MTDIEIKTHLYMLEARINQLEEKVKRMANVGDLVEVEWHLYGDVYERRNVVIKHIAKENKE